MQSGSSSAKSINFPLSIFLYQMSKEPASKNVRVVAWQLFCELVIADLAIAVTITITEGGNTRRYAG